MSFQKLKLLVPGPRAEKPFFLPMLALCLCMAAGCKSTNKSPTGGFASVVIRGNTPGQIRNVATEVFKENGFKNTSPRPDEMLFEKEGGKMSNIAYGNWISDTPVWIRVKAAVVSAGELSYRLECRAYVVRDRGGSTEEEIPMGRLKAGHYQKILDEVAKRFVGAGRG